MPSIVFFITSVSDVNSSCSIFIFCEFLLLLLVVHSPLFTASINLFTIEQLV